MSVAVWPISFVEVEASDMTQPKLKKDKHKDAARSLAVQDLQLLLGAEPHLANGFRVLAKRAKSDELRTFCKEGVTYTLRRLDRIKMALKKLDAPLEPRRSSGLDGLIRDAKRSASKTKSAETDVAILAAIERISHFGLAIYTTIDRHLGLLELRKLVAFWPPQQRKNERRSAK